ncbi:MAG TPA: NADH-quinone oxidoreductase subunit N, partial [Rectinemataceae bacterium]|nr:NADH-quinone oxidoreductase subunit N [Rectinemataceae bacterium]
LAFGRRGHAAAFGLSLVVMIAALGAIAVAWQASPHAVGGLLAVDGFTLFAQALIIASSLVVVLISFGYLQKRPGEGGEYYFLLVLATLGACILASSSSFVSLFLGLELLSTALFTLIAYRKERASGAQAGFMYLILAGVSSAFLLFGMALAYLDTGSLEVARMTQALATGPLGLLSLAGLGFMAVGIGFKLALVPFHFWTPDIYDAAPAPVTGFIASVSKGAMAVFLVRFFGPAGVAAAGSYALVFAIISGLSMFVGNLLALRESRIKRVLAYSSIAQLGYILIAFVAGGSQAAVTVSFYLVAYFASTLGAFSAITALSGSEGDLDELEQYRSLASRHPGMAAGLTVALFSLAGLPLTAGFMGKFMIFNAGEGAFLWVLAVLLAVNSTISIFYYLRIVSLMYRPREEARHAAPVPGSEAAPDAVSSAASAGGSPGNFSLAALALGITVVVTVLLGILPQPLVSLIRTLVTGN